MCLYGPESPAEEDLNRYEKAIIDLLIVCPALVLIDFTVPIKSAAQELGLALHERDTFTGWTV